MYASMYAWVLLLLLVPLPRVVHCGIDDSASHTEHSGLRAAARHLGVSVVPYGERRTKRRGALAKGLSYLQQLNGHVQQRTHQEGAVASYRDLLIMLGGFNVSAESAAAMSTKQISEAALGTDMVTIYNLTSDTIIAGPPLPHRMNHNAAVVDHQGNLHVIGAFGYLRKELGVNHSSHFVWKLPEQVTQESAARGAWRELAPLENTTGTTACEFANGRIYCFGGALFVQSSLMAHMMIYTVATDSWSQGARMPEPADHIDSYLLPGGTVIGLVGGRNYFRDDIFDPGFKSAFGLEHYTRSSSLHLWYDTEAGSFDVRAPLPTARSSVQAGVIQRPGGRVSVLAVGGQVYNEYSGASAGVIEEYDPKSDIWYCHTVPLRTELYPIPYSAGHATFNGTFIMVSGSSRFFLSASPHVVKLRVDALPVPEPCMYRHMHMQRWWEGPTSSSKRNPPHHVKFLARRLLSWLAPSGEIPDGETT